MYLALGIDDGVGVGIVENGEIIATVGAGHTIDEVVNADAWATNSERVGTRVKSTELVKVVQSRGQYKITPAIGEQTLRVAKNTPVNEITLH